MLRRLGSQAGPQMGPLTHSRVQIRLGTGSVVSSLRAGWPVLIPRRGVAFVQNSEPSRPTSANDSSVSQSIRGIRKDPETYLRSPSGIMYPGDAETLAPVRQFLGDSYALPDPLALQSVVHKSFAHAKMAYNEKLAILGQQLLRMQASRAVAALEVHSPLRVNGHNFDVENRAVELLTSTPVLSQVAQTAGLDPALFWRPTSATHNGLPRVRAKAIQALTGAVLLNLGHSAAESFVADRLFKGPYSVFTIADGLYHP